MILVVQVVIYALYSIASLILVYATAKIFFDFQFKGSWLQFLSSYFLVMVSMFSIGMMVGGIAPNIKTASIVASVLYLPMLIFQEQRYLMRLCQQHFKKLQIFYP